MMTSALQENNDDGFNHVILVESVPTAKELVGFVIEDRWEITKLQYDTPPESGGNFGTGYFAYDRKDKVERFIKVVDYLARLAEISQLTKLLQLAQFEVAMHKYCVRMSKVVRMIAHGQLFFKTPTDIQYNFLCLVLEKGEGDIKNHVDYSPDKSPYWKLCVLRDVALAITQIERGNLAHNDIKPSNVIRFESKGTTHNIKLGDVGRVVTKEGNGPFDGEKWAGDPAHKPIEALYGWSESEFHHRNTAADAYMLGNLVSFLFVGASITERIVNSLPPEYRPGIYKGGYMQVLDVVRHAWNAVVTEQISPFFPEKLREEMTLILKCLTNPEPQGRGDHAARKQGILGMDRIHSKLVRLAYQALSQESTAAAK